MIVRSAIPPLLLVAAMASCGEDPTDPTPPPGCEFDADNIPLCAWPAEAPADAHNLTGLENDAPNDFYENLSAASWRADTNMLWIGRNGPDDLSKIWALEPDGDGGFTLVVRDDERAEWTHFGDLEGISHIEGDDPWTVYTLIEGEEAIEAWDLTDFEDDHRLNRWDLSDLLPFDEDQGDGAEGLAFVTDAQLTEGGFVDGDGQAVTSSGGLGGLFLVGHQNGGHVYAFDLAADGDEATLIGAYETYADETAGLEYDDSSGHLYLWHGSGNRLLEITTLSSTATDTGRRLNTQRVYTAPDGEGDALNWEGIALRNSCDDGDLDLFITEDDGGSESLFWFERFPCP